MVEASIPGPTCLQFQVKCVSVPVQGPRQSDPHLERLSPADDEVLTLVEVGVVIGAVLPRLALHQVDGSHSEEELCRNMHSALAATSDPTLVSF